MYERLSLVRRVSQIGTLAVTWLLGERVGEDAYGNRYYRCRKRKSSVQEKRWVIYAGEPEATMIPPDWYGWLHNMCDQPLRSDPEYRYVWQKPHQPNLSGSEVAPLPPRHPLNQFAMGRDATTGDVYQSWNPHE